MAELRIKAEKENLDQVTAFIEEELAALDCPMDLVFGFDVMIEEIFVNIASYAYPKREGDAIIILEKLNEGKTVRLTCIDTGTPYNPLEKPDPDITLSAEERPIGGLGIYMVKDFMDDMTYRYENGQNILTMEKNIE